MTKYTGLTEKEAADKLKAEGYNELPEQKKQSVWVILWEVITEPMLLLIIGSGIIYLFLGEPRDALMLLSFVIVVVGITFYQEQKTERALEALKDLSSPRALVIRGGEQLRIAGREVVRDDILVLQEGDRVPADAVVLYSANLLVDESLLTGESLPVMKREYAVADSVARDPFSSARLFRQLRKSASRRDTSLATPATTINNEFKVFSGTMITQGHGIARVFATGIHTEMGKIGRSLESITEEDTLLQKETGQIVKKFAIAGIFVSVLVVVIFGLTRGHWLQGFLAGLSLSMAVLPEEFGVILVVFLALGAWRISKSKVLTRKSAAIETLGAATALCVDKTGTLTLNKMELQMMRTGNCSHKITAGDRQLPEDYHHLLEYAILASQKDPFDPIEKEVKKAGDLFLGQTEHIHKSWKFIHEYPLSKKLLALSHVWESPAKTDLVIAAKGAPEAVAELCHFNEKQIKTMTVQIQQMADRGLRVIAVAKASFRKQSLPEKQHDFNFEFVGLLGFSDPIRSTVPEAVAEAHRAGMRVIMITGDYPGTAQYIARQIGIKNPENFIIGPVLAKLDHLQLREKIKNTNIFARVVPEQKLAIVNALKANGEIVAMTGDGVNDAPALKAAHIGIAMGERGTDVAREAADLVLLNDDFSSIVKAVRLGRRIFDNLKKAMAYTLAVHVPIAGMALLPVMLQMPIVLMPAHIAFLELIIDPACSVVFESEKEEGNIMERPPRNLKEPLFGRASLIRSSLQGLGVLGIVFLVYVLTKDRTPAFLTLVLANLMLIITNLSWSKNFVKIILEKNKALYLVLSLTVIFLLIIISVPFLRELFYFSTLHNNDYLLVAAAGLVSIIWFEALKNLL